MGKYIKRLISLIDEADNGNTDAMLEFIMTIAVSNELSSESMIKEKCTYYVEILPDLSWKGIDLGRETV